MLTNKDKINLLKKIEIFSGFSFKTLNFLSSRVVVIKKSAGEIVFRKGAPGDSLYIIIDGEVSISSSEFDILTRGRNECIGEMALIDNLPRSATVRAVTDTTMLRVHKNDFDDLLEHEPLLYRELLKVLSARLRQDINIQTDTMKKKAAIEQDIRRAAEIQKCMLPKSDLSSTAIEVFGECHPAIDIAGDYFDYKLLPDGRIAVVIGDVSGHGFGSGLFVAIAKSCFETQMMTDPNPVKLLHNLDYAITHASIRDYNEELIIMTFCCILVDPFTHTLTYANAGQPMPYLYTKKTKKQLPQINVTLGMSSMFGMNDFKTIRIPYQQGDLLVLFSDGLVEQRNEDGKEFGYETLERIVANHQHYDIHSICDTVFTALHAHCPSGVPADDVTLVLARLL